MSIKTKIIQYRAIFIFVIAALLPVFITNNYWLHLLSIGGIFAIVTLSLNILTGYTGLFSVGHIAFYGIGAYTAAIMTTRLGTNFLINILAAGVVAMLFGMLLGVPTLRLKGMYLGVATIAFNEIIYQIFLNWDPVTGGSKGILGIAPAELFGMRFNTYRSYYYVVLLFLGLIVILTHNLIHSRTGRAFLAVRESEIAAEALGVNVVRFKIRAFSVAAFFAGVAGALYTYEIKVIFPESFAQSESATILAMMVVGGMGSIPGSIIGGIVLTIIPEVLRFVGNVRLVLYGAAIVAIVIFAPKGIGGFITWLSTKITSRLKEKTK